MSRISISFIFLFFIAVPVCAQDSHSFVDKIVALIEENESKKDNLRRNEEQYDTLCQQIAKLRQVVAQDSLRLQDISDSIAAFSKENAQQQVIVLSNIRDSLKQVYTQKQKDVESMRSDISALNSQDLATQEEIEKMSKYGYTSAQYAANKEYLKSRYSQMSMSHLYYLRDSAKGYSAMEDYNDYLLCIAIAIRNKEIYSTDSLALCELHTPQEIKHLRDLRDTLMMVLYTEKSDLNKGLYPLTPQQQRAIDTDLKRGIYKLSTIQFNELDTLDIYLSRYKDGMIKLKEMIDFTNNNMEIKRIRENSKMDKETIKRVRKEVEEKFSNDYEKYFNNIPILKNLVNSFWHDLSTNPLNYPTKTENRIENY